MEDIMITSISPIIGVFVGFFLSYGTEWWKKRSLTKNYSLILHSELKGLKEDVPEGLDRVIHGYEQLVAVRHGINTEIVPANQNPADYLKRWSFRTKYVFLQNNLEKISLFKADTIKSILKIYSYLEEFEEYKQISISDPDALERIGMGDVELLLSGNLIKARNEIPHALSFLERE